MTNITALVKLVAKYEDFGYTTYVFECLEEYMIKQTKYIMCVRYPDWQHKELNIDDIGYLEFREIRAGVDQWFDGENMIPFRYDSIQFIKFIDKPKEKEDEKYVM